MTNTITRMGLLSLVCLAALGCDPGGPGAEGTISLAPELDASLYATLELRAFPEPEGEFDVLDGAPTSGEIFVQRHDLADIEFPFEYLLGGGVGTTEFKRWRVLAWLSATKSDAELPNGPVAGEWYGTATFAVKECGGMFDGYCGVTGGVNLTIDTELP